MNARARRSLCILSPLVLAAVLPAQDAKAAVVDGTKQTSEAQPDSSAPAEKRAVQAADYGKWESLGFRTEVSNDGRWIAYSINRVNDEDELRLRALGADATETIEYGQRPQFSENSLWFGYLVGVSADETEKLRESKKPVRTQLGLRDLLKGETDEVEDVASFSFSEDGRFVAMRRFPYEDDRSTADLVVRDLATGTDTCLGNVDDYEWSEAAPLLALTIASADEVGNGVQLYDAAGGSLRTLDSANAKYGRLSWREDADDLACLRELPYEEDEDEDVAHVVLSWRGLAGASPSARTYDPRKAEGFPEELRVVSSAGVRWAEDGAALFFGLKEWERAPEWARGEEEEEDDEEEKPEESEEQDDKGEEEEDEPEELSLRESLDEAAGVEIWHAGDIDVIPLQQKRIGQAERKNWLAAWWLDSDRLVRIGEEPIEEVRLLEGDRHALGLDNAPYEELKRFGPTLNDVWVIDVTTGERSKVLSGVKYVMGSSPDGRFFAYVQDEAVWIHDVIDGTNRNLTGGVPTKFINQEASQLTDEKPPYGIAGWCVNSDELFLYDRYDLWMLPVDGSEATRMTAGAEQQNRYRLVNLDPEDDDGIDLGSALYLSVYGDRSKRSGYSRIVGGGRPERLIWEEKNVSRLAKAEDADVYTFVEEKYDESPNRYVSGADLADAKQITDTNAFQSDYLWGTSELVDYTNAHGEELQGALFYPANYEPGKQYPMIVYIYELRSQVLNRYATPTELHPYNTAVYSAQGYFVFQPDIVYRPQNPGLSALECVEPAVKKVLESGRVDPERVGLVGHSWGAYQTAFLVTQTEVFAAGIAGAPLTNMMSMSLSMYWNSGQTDAWIFHESQGRMDRPFWRDIDTYIRNSPVFNIDKMNTPLMIAFGTDDGAVDWNQGVEMFNAARLAGKQFVMLVYPGENHGLRKKPNQVDYHHRVLEWFAHYLKGDPAPTWITEGQEWIDRKKELEEFERSKKKGEGKGKK